VGYEITDFVLSASDVSRSKKLERLRANGGEVYKYQSNLTGHMNRKEYNSPQKCYKPIETFNIF